MITTDKIKKHIVDYYPYIGETRRREMARLIYEIAKKEKCDVYDVTQAMPQPPTRFDQIKTYLVKRRYPMASEQGVRIKQSYPDIDINPDFRMDIGQPLSITPQRIVVEKGVEGCALQQRMTRIFPDAEVQVVESYREHHKRGYNFGDYNKRLNAFYIVEEKFEFFKPCPCSQGSTHCGYHIVNLGSGCGFECAYCYLQDFLKKPGMLFPGNLDTFFKKYLDYREKYMDGDGKVPQRTQTLRIGSGEATDSLLFDHITGFSMRIVDFMRDYPDTQFEFKTKSTNIDQLLSVPGAPNIMIAWSMNTPRVNQAMEYYTASIEERLQAAEKCVAHGYSVCFHFDPIIYYDGWAEEYADVIHMIAERIPEDKIGWLSLGLLRMTPSLKKAIENRFPKTPMLNGELLTGYDQKLRYEEGLRQDMYQHMMSTIRQHYKKVYVYLCMEAQNVCSTQCSDGPTLTP